MRKNIDKEKEYYEFQNMQEKEKKSYCTKCGSGQVRIIRGMVYSRQCQSCNHLFRSICGI